MKIIHVRKNENNQSAKYIKLNKKILRRPGLKWLFIAIFKEILHAASKNFFILTLQIFNVTTKSLRNWFQNQCMMNLTF